jgi:fatty-acyl-CoA synthase
MLQAVVGSHSDRYRWPEFDENTASSICYTSGTPEAALPDALNVSARDLILPVVLPTAGA